MNQPEACTDAARPLNLAGTRRAPRFNVVDGIQVHVDGRAATLVDLSLVGAQLITSSRIKPGQRVNFSFEDQGRKVRIRSTVAWACFEVIAGTPRYRAGIEFFDVEEAPLQRLIDTKRKTIKARA